jgi:hypothetical protein
MHCGVFRKDGVVGSWIVAKDCVDRLRLCSECTMDGRDESGPCLAQAMDIKCVPDQDLSLEESRRRLGYRQGGG